MNRQSVLIAFGIAVVLICVIALTVVVRQALKATPAGVDYYAIQSLEQRLDQMEQRFEEGLTAILQRRTGAEFGGPGGAPRGDGAPEEGEEPGAEESPGGGDDPLQVLMARMDDLELRLRGLEEDPIERGYNYLSSQNSELRRQGIFALERIAKSDPQARETIRQMLQDPDAGVRRAALDTLADMEDKEAAPWVASLLADSDTRVRREAIETLARLESRDSAPQIAALVADPDDGVRAQAVDVLGKLKYQGGAEALVQALEDPNDNVRGEAIASLGEIGAKSAAPLLRGMYNQDPGRHRFRLVWALKNLGDNQPFQQEVSRMSKAALEGADEGARREAIRTLSWFARDQAKDVFQQALQDPSERVRREAQRALERGRDRGRRG